MWVGKWVGVRWLVVAERGAQEGVTVTTRALSSCMSLARVQVASTRSFSSAESEVFRRQAQVPVEV